MQKIIEKIGGRFLDNSDQIFYVINELKILKNSQILDIGTGSGKMAIHLALMVDGVITGEPKDDHYADWKTPAKAANVFEKITFIPFKADNLPFDDNMFDYIFIYGSLHHIKNQDASFKEFHRVLKNQGRLIIFEPTQKKVEEIRKIKPKHVDPVDPLMHIDSSQFFLDKTQSNSSFLVYFFNKK